MRQKIVTEPILKILFLSFGVVWLCLFAVLNEVPANVGDGIQHFFISQASWENPRLFLNHWGKPIFTLLSSPFSHLGFLGHVCFNVLIYSATVAVGYRILSHLKIAVLIQILFPLILLSAVDYSVTILGGLTEPLFNLAVVLSCWFLLRTRYTHFAVLVSFMPFMRSEGQLPLVLAFLLLIYLKQNKSLPFILSGFMLYGVVGLLVYHNFWWYFTDSPYDMANAIYGKGNWNHYFISYQDYLGIPGFYVGLLCVISMLKLACQKKWIAVQIPWMFYAYGTFFGIVFLHAYFWATGQNGSLGLTRIATQGMPLFILLSLYYIGTVSFMSPKLRRGVFASTAVILVLSLTITRHFPVSASPLEKQILRAANFIEKNQLKKHTIYYHFPLLAFALKENPFLPNSPLKFTSFGDLKETVRATFKAGDILVRDSHFGPQEANLPLNKLAEIPELVILHEFISSQQFDDPNNETEGVIIYQYIPLEKQKKVNQNRTTRILNKTLTMTDQDIYLDLHTYIPPLKTDTKITLELSVKGEGIVLVYDYNNLTDYSNWELNNIVHSSNTYLFRQEGETKLYLWNPKKVSGQIILHSITVEEPQYHPVFN
jgi:hypothetical protein